MFMRNQQWSGGNFIFGLTRERDQIAPVRPASLELRRRIEFQGAEGNVGDLRSQREKGKVGAVALCSNFKMQERAGRCNLNVRGMRVPVPLLIAGAQLLKHRTHFVLPLLVI